MPPALGGEPGRPGIDPAIELAFTPNFGSISSAQDSRQLQFAARFVF